MIPLNFARYDDSPAVIAKDRDDIWRKQLLEKVMDNIEFAKPMTEWERNQAIVEKQKNRQCPAHYIHGECASGHRFAKELYCGLEYCPIRVDKDSSAHKRRFASFLNKARQTKHLGTLVIEWPLNSRNKLRRRKEMESAGKTVVSVMNGNYEVAKLRAEGKMLRRGEVAEIKAKYYDRGMRRWHYFGDVLDELGQMKLEYSTIGDLVIDDIPGPAIKSNIHLNLLLDAGYIPKPWLNHIVYQLREALNEPNLIVHYGYTRDPGRMVHILKYTTRATFRDITWDEWLAGQLYGFRNMRSWGVWKDDYVWSLEDLPAESMHEVEGVNYEAVKSLGESICYKDGLPITWSSPKPISELNRIPIKIDLGAGYYELPSITMPEIHIIERPGMTEMRQAAIDEYNRIHQHDIEQLNLEMEYYGDILLQYDQDLENELKRVAGLGTQNPLPALHRTHKGRGNSPTDRMVAS